MRVESEAELVEAMRGARAPLRVVGGGTRGVVGAGARLEVAISGVRLYEPGALTLIAGAGTPLAEIEAVVAAEGQRLPFEPPRCGALLGLAGESTIGGVAATNASGPRRVQAGACRDSLIGLRFVDGAGIAVQAGGRVMKNVTGYDLVKLLAGSRGRLGVLSEVAFKLLPAAPAQATVRAEVPLSEAGQVLAAALASPFDVSGAGWLPGQGAVLRLEGLEGSVEYRAGRLAALLAPWGARIEREGSAAIWRDLAEVRPFHGRAGDIWRFSVKPSEAAAIAARLGGEVVLDWGGGLIWALLPEGTDARAQAAPYTGHGTCLRGRAPRAEPEAPAVAALSRALQARFDPRGILDPERAG